MPHIYITFYENTSVHLFGWERRLLLTSSFIEKTEYPAKAGKGVN